MTYTNAPPLTMKLRDGAFVFNGSRFVRRESGA